MSVSVWEGKPKRLSGSNQRTDFYYYPDEEMDAWLEELRAHYKLVEEQADTLRFLFGDEGVRTENLMKIQVWRTKAERLDGLIKNAAGANLGRLLENTKKLGAIRKILEGEG